MFCVTLAKIGTISARNTTNLNKIYLLCKGLFSTSFDKIFSSFTGLFLVVMVDVFFFK